MAKISYRVKVINNPKGVNGYESTSRSSKKMTTFQNGEKFYVDRMKADTDGIWYREVSSTSWVLYQSTSGKTNLKILSKSAGVSFDTGLSLKNSSKNTRKNSGSLSTSGNKKQTSDTNKKSTSAEKLPTSTISEKILTGNTVPLVNPKTGNNIVSDVVIQNEANYPPVDHTDPQTGQIWYNWVINLDSLKESVDIVKRNLNVPSAYSREQVAKLTHTKFNRYKIDYGDYRLKTMIAYAAFVRPDLNLYDDNGIILPQVINNPQLYYIYKNNPVVLKQLCLGYDPDHKFIPLLTNQIIALDISDETLETDDVGENFIGYKMQYAKDNIRSMVAGTFSVKFPETVDTSITQMIQAWCGYEHHVYRGTMMPKTKYCTYKILDYAGDLYYFLMDPDMTIRFWSAYYGVFPINVNKSIFSFDMGSNSALSEVNVTFAYCDKLDSDIRSLVHFNNLGKKITKNTQYKLDADPSVCLGGGTTWSGAPFVQLERGINNGTASIDQLKFRFRAS